MTSFFLNIVLATFTTRTIFYYGYLTGLNLQLYSSGDDYDKNWYRFSSDRFSNALLDSNSHPVTDTFLS